MGRWSSKMVSCPLFSLPCTHQYLFIISLCRCQLALVVFWFLAKRDDWMSSILLEIWLALSRAFSRLVLLSELAFSMILSLFLLRFFISVLILPIFSFVRCLALW